MLLALGAVALVAATAGTLETLELLLPWVPMLAIGGLLASRRFIGESRILARLERRRPRRRGGARPRWSRSRERALTSLHALTTQHLRGPPALVTA